MSNSILMAAFRNYTNLYSGDMQMHWEEFVDRTENTIAADTSLTDEQKFVRAISALRQECNLFVEIMPTIQFEWVGEWGYATDLFTAQSNVIYATTLNVSITLDATQSCPLFEAILNFTASNSQQHTASQSLCNNIRTILLTDYLTFFDQLAEIRSEFDQFFAAHSSWQSTFLTIEIEELGTLQDFLAVVQVVSSLFLV